MATTLRQLRRDVLRELGDIRILTATADGEEDTFVDATNLTGGVNAYAGRLVLFTDGTPANLGEQRYVVVSSRTSHSLGFSDPLPAPTAIGDECELIDTKAIGFTFQDVKEAINICLRSLELDGLVAADDADLAYAYGTGLAIPDEFRSVEYVYRQDTYDSVLWHRVPKALKVNGSGWWVDRVNRMVYVTGSYGRNHTGQTFRLAGLMSVPTLDGDDDETTVDYEWLIAAVQAKLAKARWLRMGGKERETERMVYILNQKADAMRARVLARRSPFSELL